MDAAREMAPHDRSVFALDLHPAIVQLDKAIDERKSEPRASTLSRAALRRKALEHVGFYFWRDARACVGDGDLHVLADDGAAQGDRAAGRRVFERVGKQVEDDLLNPPFVAEELTCIRRAIDHQLQVDLRGPVARR